MCSLKEFKKNVAVVLAAVMVITGVSGNAFADATVSASAKAKATRKVLKVEEAVEKEIAVTDASRFTVNEAGELTGFNAEGFEFTTNDEWNNPVGIDLVVPSEVNGVRVTAIKGAFKGLDNLGGLVLPYDLTVIDNEAFKDCKALRRINLYDPNEEKVVNENNVTCVTVHEYRGNTVTIPDMAGKIAADAFAGTSAVVAFSVPASNSAFKTLNEGVLLTNADETDLVRYASSNHSAEMFNIPEGIVNINDYACEAAVDTKGFNIPDSVKTIGNYGFYNSNLQFVKFNETSNCTTIGAYAFAHNQNLETSLPKSVTSIGAYCFAYCENLRSTATVSGAAISVASGTAISADTTTGLIDKSSITEIPDYCFYDSRNLHSLNIPATVQKIGAYAFSEVVNISTVTFEGETLSAIGTGAFEGADNLNTIVIPEGVTTIEDDTFNGCINLGVVVLPESLEVIGDEAFKDCHNINTMVIPGNVAYISNTSFDGANTSNIDVSESPYASYVVKGIKVATPAAVGKKFTYGSLKYKVTAVVTTKGAVKRAEVRVIGYKSKKIAKKAKAINVPAKAKFKGFAYKVVGVNNNALKNGKKVKKVVIGANIKQIGNNAFYGLRNLKMVNVKSKKITKVGKRAFGNANKKAAIKVPKKCFKKYKKLFRGKGIKRIRK
ncbi:MAG: leucine-rich repeat domain-containing protein [Lachnospiraceae bacterium]|nr:leucine-rich repeat domain-containing protein [Lachnospiraceae bacterium]